MYKNYQTHNPYGQTIPSANKFGQKLRPKTTTLRPNQRFKNSNSFATINNNINIDKGKYNANSDTLTFSHDANMMYFPHTKNLDAESSINKEAASSGEMAQKQPLMSNSINRLNWNSAHAVSNEHIVGVQDNDMEHTIVSHENQLEGHGSEPQNQIFHVNSLIR